MVEGRGPSDPWLVKEMVQLCKFVGIARWRGCNSPFKRIGGLSSRSNKSGVEFHKTSSPTSLHRTSKSCSLRPVMGSGKNFFWQKTATATTWWRATAHLHIVAFELTTTPAFAHHAVEPYDALYRPLLYSSISVVQGDRRAPH